MFEELDIGYELKITSAHRTPEQTRKFIQYYDEEVGVSVFIAAAGYAAHLAGVVASETIKPVIGIPIDSSCLNGFDSLLSTVQMPGGIPVATVTIGKAGAKNAALLAAQIIALNNNSIREKLIEMRKKQKEAIENMNI
ncbi:MAG: 5-(carboxyamino)imidazole ribonucleotide mutase [Nitrospinae bacterium]|nr:5-(carboxyamino)imidazole ribonucleotide mutase [Nitrospinota bacterium]